MRTFPPDGRWVSYELNESGRNEVYVRPFPAVDSGTVAGFDQRWKPTPGGAEQPRALFPSILRAESSACPFKSGPGFIAGNLQVVCQEPARQESSHHHRQVYAMCHGTDGASLADQGLSKAANRPPRRRKSSSCRTGQRS